MPPSPSLTSVHAVAVDNVYAVGKRGTILRHDGKAWAQLPRSFSPAGAKAPDLYAVWASGPRDLHPRGPPRHLVRPGRDRPRRRLAGG